MNRALFSLLVLFLAALPAVAAVSGSDQQIAQKLTGTWVGLQKGFQGTLEYRADGLCVSNLVPVDFLMKMFARPYSFKGTWKIENGKLVSTVSTSNTKAIKPGTVYQNEILKLTASVFLTKNERGWVTEFKRKS